MQQRAEVLVYIEFCRLLALILNAFRAGTMTRISQTNKNFITKHHLSQAVDQTQVKTYNEPMKNQKNLNPKLATTYSKQ